MPRLRIAIVGTLAGNPFAGMAWMTMQFVVGLRRLGHDVMYLEVTSDWPFDPESGSKVPRPTFAVAYLAEVADWFGVGERWAYRASYSDRRWYGPCADAGEAFLREADLVLNVAGATRFRKEELEPARPVYLGTDPVVHEIAYAQGDPGVIELIDSHTDCVTYGENIGTAASPVPALPRLRAHTRQPVLLDLWDRGGPQRPAFTTVGNWKQVGLDLAFEDEVYLWSKHHEFLRFIALPRLVGRPVELATNLRERAPLRGNENEAVPSMGMPDADRRALQAHGWSLVYGPDLSSDPWTYRDYITGSSGEFTVARDLNVRLRSGWFSERSACYLAAGRPVITQDTGFGTALPVGKGLLAFETLEEAVDAFRRIEADYSLHARAAREIAAEYFAHDRVLTRLLTGLGA